MGYRFDGFVRNMLCILGFFFLCQGLGLKPSASHLYQNISRVQPHPSMHGERRKEMPAAKQTPGGLGRRSRKSRAVHSNQSLVLYKY